MQKSILYPIVLVSLIMTLIYCSCSSTEQPPSIQDHMLGEWTSLDHDCTIHFGKDTLVIANKQGTVWQGKYKINLDSTIVFAYDSANRRIAISPENTFSFKYTGAFELRESIPIIDALRFKKVGN